MLFFKKSQKFDPISLYDVKELTSYFDYDTEQFVRAMMFISSKYDVKLQPYIQENYCYQSGTWAYRAERLSTADFIKLIYDEFDRVELQLFCEFVSKFHLPNLIVIFKPILSEKSNEIPDDFQPSTSF